MRVLVTGGAGFIGSHIAETLWRNNIAVAVLDNLSTGLRHNVPSNIPFYQVDIRNPEALKQVFADFQPTHVSHQAAQSSVKVSVEQPLLDAEVNVIGGLNVLHACMNSGVQKVVFASTGGALYGEVPPGQTASEDWPARPKSPYAASKAAFEGYLGVYQQNYGLAYTTLRYGNVYGPRQNPHGEAGVVAIFAGRLLEGQGLKLYARRTAGDDGCIRDYVHIDDVVSANLLALNGDLQGTYNVGSGQGNSTLDILKAVAESLGIKPQVEASAPRPGDLERTVLNPARLLAQGWHLTHNFSEGVRQTALWFAQHREQSP